ncbi:MAG: hypothetical protein ACOCX4_02605, partial [Planctomycetota bacterium]
MKRREWALILGWITIGMLPLPAGETPPAADADEEAAAEAEDAEVVPPALAQARTHYDTGRWNACRQAYEAYLKTEPPAEDLEEVRYRLAQCLAQIARSRPPGEPALEQLRAARNQLAELRKERQVLEAPDRVAALARTLASEYEAHLVLQEARLAVNNGRLAAAETAFRRAIHLQQELPVDRSATPFPHQALFELAACLQQRAAASATATERRTHLD